MAKIKSKVSQIQPQSSRQEIVQNISQSQQQVLQQDVPSEKQVVHRVKPRYPSWPTSKPGPQSTPPPVGMRSINPFRPEQITEIDFSREIDQPSADSLLHSAPDASIHGSTSSDQSKNAQDTLGKRKHRL
jgi:hypothetical protein